MAKHRAWLGRLRLPSCSIQLSDTEPVLEPHSPREGVSLQGTYLHQKSSLFQSQGASGVGSPVPPAQLHVPASFHADVWGPAYKIRTEAHSVFTSPAESQLRVEVCSDFVTLACLCVKFAVFLPHWGPWGTLSSVWCSATCAQGALALVSLGAQLGFTVCSVWDLPGPTWPPSGDCACCYSPGSPGLC